MYKCPTILSEDRGEFQNKETSVWFTYEPITNAWGIANGLTHEIHTIDGNRCAIVKKTVVYVAVDEAANGSAILEKWLIKSHTVHNGK
jgi:hypothetical protein